MIKPCNIIATRNASAIKIQISFEKGERKENMELFE